MKKKFVVCSLMFVVMGLSAVYCFAKEPAAEYQRANNLYQKQSFDSAAKIYEGLIAQEYFSPEAYYNLGNCYYKTGKNAGAILNYERALKLKPSDEDILFNLKVAQLKVIDKIETVPEIFYVRWTKNLSAVFSTDGWGAVITICVWLMFLSAAVYAVSQVSILKKAGFVLAVFFFAMTCGSWFLANQNYVSNKVNKNAIIMSVSAYVKSSPGENNTDLFLLHEGTKVNVLDEYENWVKIKIANGSVGWLKKSEMEVI